MKLQTKDLLFFNKEGNPMNLNYNENSDMWNGKIYFDKNSTETYKTQGIYMFEKIQGTNNSFDAYLEKFQLFNTSGFKTFPKYNAQPLQITDIRSVNLDSDYNTKWIYADGIENYFYPGMWCYISGVDGFHNNDFNTFDGDLQVIKIFAVERNRVLIFTNTPNNIIVPAFNNINIPNIDSVYITAIDVIEVLQTTSEPAWTETNIPSKIYKNKKISYITSTENSGVYNIEEKCNSFYSGIISLDPNMFIPNMGDKLKIDIKLYTSNIEVTNGLIEFIGNDIIVPYVPSFLKIGDTIQAQSKNILLNSNNLVQFTITGLDRINKKISVHLSTYPEITDCYIYLASNIFTIEQEVLLDNNNIYSLPLTYWSIVNKYYDELLNVAGGAELLYNEETDELHISSQYINNYASVDVSSIDINNNITTYTTNADIINVYPLYVSQPLKIEDNIKGDSTLYNKNIVFTSIDNYGLNIKINGIRYGVPYDTSVSNTISEFITAFDTRLIELGIILTQPSSNILNIQSDFPNVPVFTECDLGDNTIYHVQYKDIEFNNIKSQLLITINSEDYLVPFDSDDETTLTNWVNTYKSILYTYKILVDSTVNTLHFNLLENERTLDITYNIGYIPKSGDLSVYETLYSSKNNGSLISGNEIRCALGLYNFLDYYSIGQKIAISGALKTSQNKSYNIIGLTENIISLSYQGAFWQQQTPSFILGIVSDYFIRFPKSGLISNAQNKLNVTWKDTQVNDFFFYDFSGNQLVPHIENFPDYNGVLPLCGEFGEIPLKLLNTPNKELNQINNPSKQQTVFDNLEFPLPYYNDSSNFGVEPDPLQIFIGYNTVTSGWNKARIYVELKENIKLSITTDNNMYDNLWVFKDNYLEIQSPSYNINLIDAGFTVGQVIEIESTDENPDGLKISTMYNSGKKYKIKEIQQQKIIFTTDVIEESSVKEIPVPYAPYYDIYGNINMIQRNLTVNLTVAPKIIAYFDIYGESEDEDERHKINLNNKNLDILTLQDVYIFEEVDINEKGIDWIYLNRKRKELIEIYPEIFNNIGSYKSVIDSINFFGYNDLTFTEYFQNIDPESNKFGQLLNMELIGLLDKNVKGWEYSNLAYENLRNEGFRKTNLFSLNYKITDKDGNFINAYSLDEVKIKLLGLKRWLTTNIIPLGTKISDINGKYTIPNVFTLNHQTYMTKNYRVLEYGEPVDFKVSGYLHPTTQGSNTYDISVEFFNNTNNIEWYEYVIRTFDLTIWNDSLTYLVNNVVYLDGEVWKCINTTIINDKPGLTVNWIKTNFESLTNIQTFKNYMYTAGNTSFTINEMVDPHFIVDVYWHSGYATTYKNSRTYSVLTDFFE